MYPADCICFCSDWFASTTRDDKLYFIEAYFEDIEARLNRLYTIVEQGLLEEALILACCYLNGFTLDRFGLPKGGDDTKLFTQFLRQYDGESKVFDKVCLIEITHRSENDPFAPKALNQHNVVVAAILGKYGPGASVDNDPSEADLLQLLSGIPKLDGENLRLNLWRYTYSAVLYRRWRNTGVHEGRIGNRTDVASGKKIYPAGENGEGVYYDSFDRLTFSSTFVMATLQNAFTSLKEECVRDAVFPQEITR